jgi:multiple sugar transport system substrate-binding protein
MNRLAPGLWRLGAGLLVLMLALAGCDSSAPTAATPGAGAPSGEISFQIYGEPAEAAAFQTIAAAYGAAHPDIHIIVSAIPTLDDYMTRLAAEFSAGSPPDVFLLNYRRFAQFAPTGVLEPLGARLAQSAILHAEDFYPEALAAYTYQGTLQCLPLSISSMEVYYNPELFARHNVPLPAADWTWQDFLNTARALTIDSNGDGRLEQFGVGMEPNLSRLAPFVWERGGELTDSPTQPTTLTLDAPASRDALQFFAELSLVHRVVPTEAEEQAEELEDYFMEGRMAMFVGPRDDTAMFRTIKNLTFDVAPMPRDKQAATLLTSDGYCLAAGAKHKEAGWDFLQFAAGPDGQTIAAKQGRSVPSLKSIAASPAFLDPTQAPAHSQVYLDAIPMLHHIPQSPAWSSVERAFDQELERAFYGTAPIDQALQLATDVSRAEFAKIR